MHSGHTRQRCSPPLLAIAVLALVSTGCGGGGGSGSQAAGSNLPAAETVQKFVDANNAAQADYASAPVTVSGQVLDTDGQPLPGVAVTLAAATTSTEQDGTFALSGLTRGNAWLQLDGPTIRREVFPVALYSDAVDAIELPAFVATPNDGATRLLFAGDSSFGRRFLDPEGLATTTEVPAGSAAALIDADNPLPGSRTALSFVAPLIEQADYPVVNFESPILTDPATPHPTKDFVFFSLPGSLPALKELGINYVSLGNNHVYDYLAQGLDDTLAALDDAQINHSGAARTPDDAYLPHRVELANEPYSLISATSVAGSQHDILYVADETQGGAADLRDDFRLQDAISMESAASRFVIAQLHTGKEYLFSPSAFALERMLASVGFGADLVVAHHPHVAQGVSYENGVLMYHGLGNFLFDQDRHETMLGLLAQVDVDDQRVLRARARPVYLEDYRPRPISGDLANRFLRRISEFSAADAAVIPYHAEAWIAPDRNDFNRVAQSVDVAVTVPDSGVAVVDLRHHVPSDYSLASVSAGTDAPALRLGRDLLLYGDFDDYDLDPDRLEAARWNIQSSASFTCQAPRYRGPQALCLTRSASNQSDTVVAFRNRVRVMGDALNVPNKDLTLVAYVRGDNAGPFSIVSRYYPSSGSGDFGEEAMTHPGGTFGWQLLHRDLNMPADQAQFDAEPERNPRALRLFVRHSPMASGVGMATVDEIAVVNWEEAIDPATELATPHARDFLRVEAAPGLYELTLEFVRYVPTVAGR